MKAPRYAYSLKLNEMPTLVAVNKKKEKGFSRLTLEIFSACEVYRSEIDARESLPAVRCGRAANVDLLG